MDILKESVDWVKAELFSTPFFILFGVLFLAVSIGFWQLGKTEIARAYIIPTMVAGILLITIGSGLFFTNKSRVVSFPLAYKQDRSEFISSEIARAESTLKEYKNIVFTTIPIIIALCSICIIFVSTPIWRASMITSIAMLTIILLIDGTAHARIDAYSQTLISIENEN